MSKTYFRLKWIKTKDGDYLSKFSTIFKKSPLDFDFNIRIDKDKKVYTSLNIYPNINYRTYGGLIEYAQVSCLFYCYNPYYMDPQHSPKSLEEAKNFAIC